MASENGRIAAGIAAGTLALGAGIAAAVLLGKSTHTTPPPSSSVDWQFASSTFATVNTSVGQDPTLTLAVLNAGSAAGQPQIKNGLLTLNGAIVGEWQFAGTPPTILPSSSAQVSFTLTAPIGSQYAGDTLGAAIALVGTTHNTASGAVQVASASTGGASALAVTKAVLGVLS